MRQLIVTGEAGIVMRRTSTAAVEALIADGRAFLDNPAIGRSVTGYEIRDPSGRIELRETRTHREADPLQVGDRVIYTEATLDGSTAFLGRLVAVGPRPGDREKGGAPPPACYHIAAREIIRDAVRIKLAAPVLVYPPATTPPPEAASPTSITRDR